MPTYYSMLARRHMSEAGLGRLMRDMGYTSEEMSAGLDSVMSEDEALHSNGMHVVVLCPAGKEIEDGITCAECPEFRDCTSGPG